MNIYEITFGDGAVTKTKAMADIWTGMPGVASVQDLGPVPVKVSPTVDRILPKLDFLRHAATQLGSGGRVVEIEEAFAGHASADIRYAHKEYAATDSFTKDKVKEFLDAGEAAGILTDVENAAVIDNWPES